MEDASIADLVRIASDHGVAGGVFSYFVAIVHARLTWQLSHVPGLHRSSSSSARHLTVRHLTNWALLTRQQLSQGAAADVRSALYSSFVHTYVQPLIGSSTAAAAPISTSSSSSSSAPTEGTAAVARDIFDSCYSAIIQPHLASVAAASTSATDLSVVARGSLFLAPALWPAAPTLWSPLSTSSSSLSTVRKDGAVFEVRLSSLLLSFSAVSHFSFCAVR